MKERDRPPHDAFDEIVVRSGSCIQHIHQKPIAKDGRAIGDLHHLRDIVADEDDARALRYDPADEREQLIDADARQEWRRLIQHQEPVAASSLARPKVLDRPDDREQRLLC
jgi:hypothetical protein